MSGVSNAGFRALARRGGAALVFGETLSAKALLGFAERAPRHGERLARLPLLAREPNSAVQLFGSDPGELGAAAAWLAERGARWVDLNAGCPVGKFIRAGAGAALLKTPTQLAACVRRMRESFPGTLSVKMRSGWDATLRAPAEIAKRCAAEGVDLIAVHGRTRSQHYRGTSDLAAIRSVVRAVTPVPVLANGDVVDSASARRALRDTGAAGLMIGRAAAVQPWLFSELLGERTEPGARLAGLRECAPLLAAEFPDACHRLHPLRRLVAALVRGLPGARTFRRESASLADTASLENAVYGYLEGLCAEKTAA
jgi:nifR3 family TIM-barrel protein